MQIGIDLETFSPENIQRAGLYRYTLHPEFDILLCGFSINGGDTVVLDCTTNEGRAELLKMAPILWDAAYTKTAFNAAFEWFCLSVYLNRYGLRKEILPIEQWQDTQLAAQYCGYPRKLELVGEAMGLPDDKKKKSIGKSLIRLFCVPRTPTKKDRRTRVYPSEEPEKWNLFKEYNAGDVVAEQEILRRLSKWPVPEAVQQQWQLDAMQNFRGVNVDLALVDGALKISADNTERLLQEAAEITQLENPNSRDQLHEWLTKELPDNDIPDLKKDTVTGLLNGVSDDTVRRVLEIQQETGKAAHKKYGAIRDMVCADGRLRGLMMFYGANRTGRWCIAEGSLVRVKTSTGEVMEKPIESVLLTDLVWDGEDWVKHDGVIFQGVKSVVTWDGVTATPDHLVWVSPTERISLTEAVARKLKLWPGY